MFNYKISCRCAIIFLLVPLFASFSNSFDIENDLVFRLYTPEDPNVIHILKADANPPPVFNFNRPTRIFIHGFKSRENTIIRYKDAFLNLGSYNFIAVDWINGANTLNYLKAKALIQPISGKLAQLIDALVMHGLKSQDVTVVGHSLGAHIGGLAAKQLMTSSRIACIIGLDPASVGFDYSKSHKRLDISDADFVEIIHTDGTKFGFAKPLGHADFYPNGGKSQPGCGSWPMGKCSHSRSHDLLLESLTYKFPAVQCNSYEELENNTCTFHNVIGFMGGDITATTSKDYGIFYLETKSTSPYNIPDHRYFSNKTIVYPPNSTLKKLSHL